MGYSLVGYKESDMTELLSTKKVGLNVVDETQSIS